MWWLNVSIKTAEAAVPGSNPDIFNNVPAGQLECPAGSLCNTANLTREGGLFLRPKNLKSK